MEGQIRLIDTTLREGEQSPGLLFSEEEKKDIVDGLVKIGITEAELGIASELQADCKNIIGYCRSQYPQLELSLWSRCKKNDIAYAAARQPDIISLSIPVSEIHLHDKLQRNKDWAKSTMLESIDYAIRSGMRVSVGFEDATRSDTNFLEAMAKAAGMHGATRIRIADTVGIASPGKIAELVKSLTQKVPQCSVGVHAHNDFGMATANSISALEAGAEAVDVVALGLGERTGCARLEEVVGYLSLVKDYPGLQPQYLKPLAQKVATISGRNISPTRPVIGEDIFTCETGLHLQGLQKNPGTYEPFNPEKVQARRRLLYGCKSGRTALVHRCNEVSDTPINNLNEGLVGRIRKASKELRRPLYDEELKRLLSTC